MAIIHHQQMNKTNILLLLQLFHFLLLLTTTTTTTTAYTSSDSSKNNNNSNTNTNNNNNNIMKAWTCHGMNQKSLVANLRKANIIKSKEVQEVMELVDRANFCGGGQHPYQDAPQPIGLGQTISAPHMHAHVLEEILPYLKNSKSKELNLLDVGCGSGYLTACFGEWVRPRTFGPIVGKTGKVYGIDVKLIEQCRENLKAHHGGILLKDKIIQVDYADGWKGAKEQQQTQTQENNNNKKKLSFDAIHVGAAAEEFPEKLMEQLRIGGVMVVPVGPQGGTQLLYRVERLEKDYRIQQLLAVRYVPLIHP